MALSSPSLPRFFEAAVPHRLAVLRALWPVIAGEGVANHSEVVGMQGEVLRIRADTTSWLKTVRDLKGTLIMRFRDAAGPLAPRALAFIEGPLSAKPMRRRPRPPVAAVPIEGLSPAIVEAAARLPTAEAREACLHAAAMYKARFGDAAKS
jgi:hypothetical protein